MHFEQTGSFIWVKPSLAWRGVGIRECVPSRKVFIKPQRGNHQIEIECYFRHETDHPRTSQQQWRAL